MAANLKKGKNEGEAGKAEGSKGFSLDMKWLFAALGLALIVFSSVIIGVKVAVDRFTVQTKEVEKVVKGPEPGPIMPVITDGVVNLNGGRFLRYSASVQFAKDKVLFPEGGGGGEGKKENPLAKYEPLMKDTFVSLISKHTANDLLNPDGKEKLKLELKVVLNNLIKEMHENAGEEGIGKTFPIIYKVYFTNFVIS